MKLFKHTLRQWGVAGAVLEESHDESSFLFAILLHVSVGVHSKISTCNQAVRSVAAQRPTATL